MKTVSIKSRFRVWIGGKRVYFGFRTLHPLGGVLKNCDHAMPATLYLSGPPPPGGNLKFTPLEWPSDSKSFHMSMQIELYKIGHCRSTFVYTVWSLKNVWIRGEKHHPDFIFIGNKLAFQIVSLYLFTKMKSSSLYLWIYFNEGSRKGALQNPER